MNEAGRHRAEAHNLEKRLAAFECEFQGLPGIAREKARECFLRQIVESQRRRTYLTMLRRRPTCARRQDPSDDLFDPFRAALLHEASGDFDEACWLVFLAVHFGKHRRAGWAYLRQVYGRCDSQGRWDWQAISSSPRQFRNWLEQNQHVIRSGSPGGFGNHRKYQSLNAWSGTGTGETIQTYVDWVAPPRSHRELFAQAAAEAESKASETFDVLFRSLSDVAGFGRTAKFDFLSTLGKLGLANVVPGSVYLRGATGPLRGARLLFFGDARSAQGSLPNLEAAVVNLAQFLAVEMDVLEDALCNWQKSPVKFKAFRG